MANLSHITAINTAVRRRSWFYGFEHPAFFAAKQGLGAFCHKISQTLSADNIRVTSLHPPDFETLDIDANISQHGRTGQRLLTGQSVWQTLKFVVTQPRSCHISAIHFQGPTRLSHVLKKRGESALAALVIRPRRFIEIVSGVSVQV